MGATEMAFSLQSLANLASFGSNSVSMIRRSGIDAAFSKTLRNMAEAMEFSMVNRFIEDDMAAGKETESLASRGLPLNADLGSAMVATLTRLGQNTAASGDQQPSHIVRRSITPPPASKPEEQAEWTSPVRRAGQPAPEPVADDGQARAAAEKEPELLGNISKRFESGNNGPATIGYDRNGGTSYGTYQISSRQGTMNRFLEFLETDAPMWAARLKAAGPANTGGTRGEMPSVWREIASESPELFDRLQQQFITASHYEPALASIADRTGINVDQLPRAVREVLYSTSVQHGPGGATNIFEKVLADYDNLDGKDTMRSLIDDVYALRGTKFGSSSERVQQAVLNRFQHEKSLALALLEGDNDAVFA
jgi:hypothetical protein